VKEPATHFITGTSRIEPQPVRDPLRFSYENESERFDIEPHLRTLRKHWLLIASCFGAALFIGFMRYLMATPIYTATATIMVTPPETNGLAFTNQTPTGGGPGSAPDYFTTQCDILSSRSLAARVIANLGLDRNLGEQAPSAPPGLLAGVLGTIEFWNKASAGTARETATSKAIDRAEIEQALVDGYLGGLQIEPVQNTTLVEIDYSSTDSKMAARIANAHAHAYIMQGIELSRHSKLEAADFLQKKLIELKERLQDSEIALNNYRKDHGIIPGLMSLNGKDAIVLNRLSELSGDLTAAQVARIGLEAQVQLINKKEYKSLPAVLSNPSIQSLQRELDDLYAESATLSAKYKPDYPRFATLQAKIRGVQDQLDAEVSRKVRSIQTAFREAVDRENELQNEVDQQRSLTMKLNDAAVHYALLQRDVDANRELYDSVLKAMKDASVAADAETSNAVIIDKAEPPGAPTSPIFKRIVGLWGVFGLLLGFGIAFGIDYLDNTLKEPEQVAGYLRLHTLATVPDFTHRRLSRKGGTRRELPPGSLTRPNGDSGKVAVPETRSNYSSAWEAYRILRTALVIAEGGKINQSTLITSAFSGEGKTVTAVNCAVALAMSGRRVLLLDADLRKPRCHRHLGCQNKNGLAQILGDDAKIQDAVQTTVVGNLFFIGSGEIPHNPSELLGSMAMRDTLESLKSEYDSIIIDSPPIMAVSDPLLLSTLTDGVALVVDSSSTSRQKVRAACARLHYAKANIIGVILNRSWPDLSYYNYYYQPDEPEELPGSDSGEELFGA
jgi:succinoglycan biosynthesis transport protein ExoP